MDTSPFSVYVLKLTQLQEFFFFSFWSVMFKITLQDLFGANALIYGSVAFWLLAKHCLALGRFPLLVYPE